MDYSSGNEQTVLKKVTVLKCRTIDNFSISINYELYGGMICMQLIYLPANALNLDVHRETIH